MTENCPQSLQIKTTMLPYVAAAVTILIWGATPAVTRIAVLEMDPLAAAVMRTLVAGLLVVPFVLRPRTLRPQSAQHWWVLSLVAMSGFVGFTMLFSVGVKMTSAAHSALINASIPLFSGFFGVVLAKSMPGPRWFVGITMSFVGVIYLISSTDSNGGASSLIGDSLCLLSSVCAGLGYVAGSRLSETIGTLAVTFWGVLIAALIQLPVIFFLWDIQDMSAVSLKGWLAVGYLALGASLVAYATWYWALAKGGVTRIAPMQFLMPVVSLTLAVVVFGETLTVPLLISAVMIVAGVYLSRKG